MKSVKKNLYYTTKDQSFILYHGDSLSVLPKLSDESIDLIFADPPYFLSNGGITCQSGRMVSVNKGKWDISKGIEDTHSFNFKWLEACQRILKPNATIFVSGTRHVIYSIGFAMQQLGFKILNDIVWFKVTPPPNLSCRYFTHASETILWAARDEKSKHYFDYKKMKAENGGKQMQNIWNIQPPYPKEKRFGKHPTQKPIKLLKRIITAASEPGAIVLDPFSGSGTTGIACTLLKRSYIGIDTEKDYLDLSISRYNDLSSEPKT